MVGVEAEGELVIEPAAAESVRQAMHAIDDSIARTPKQWVRIRIPGWIGGA
jgi:hypothetical protein